jgi:aryl-alcohol dehydrogenase-like predicted oxidoreductase
MNGTLKIGEYTVNRLGFGAMRITGPGIWGPPDDHDNAIAVLGRAVELGVNFIDTADAYGPEVSENLIREALHPYNGLLIATKGGLTRGGPGEWNADASPAHLRAACDASLQRLGVERITLYQLHRIDADIPFEDSLGTLMQLREEGKIEHIGLSNVDPEHVERAIATTRIASVQNNYSVLDREHEDVLQLCEQHGVAFIPYFPIGGNIIGGLNEQALDNIAGKHNATPRQIGLAWLLQHSSVILPIPGTSNLGHLEENMKATDIRLDDDDIGVLDALGVY